LRPLILLGTDLLLCFSVSSFNGHFSSFLLIHCQANPHQLRQILNKIKDAFANPHQHLQIAGKK